MPRRFLRRISRRYRQNRAAWYLKPFGAVLGHPRYFAVNRRSVSGALAIGVLISMLPIPGHTAIAVMIALFAGVNLGVAALAAWANNPLTLFPVFYFEYRLGAWLMRQPAQARPESVSWDWLQAQLGLIWKPLWLGAILTAALTGGLVYLGTNALWRWSSARRLRRRARRRA
jgi:uncharacterized protein (DUF2062 family)